MSLDSEMNDWESSDWIKIIDMISAFLKMLLAKK